MPTYVQCEQRLWTQANAEQVVISVGNPSEHIFGWVDVKLGERRIRIHKARRDTLLRTLIDELVHDAFRVELSPWGVIEEDIVLMLERNVWRVIEKNPKRLEKWQGFLDAVKQGDRKAL